MRLLKMQSSDALSGSGYTILLHMFIALHPLNELWIFKYFNLGHHWRDIECRNAHLVQKNHIPFMLLLPLDQCLSWLTDSIIFPVASTSVLTWKYRFCVINICGKPNTYFYFVKHTLLFMAMRKNICAFFCHWLITVHSCGYVFASLYRTRNIFG